jgi:hypothetical protein
MGTGREIRVYDYVNHPYEQVRAVLSQDALTVFRSATRAAEARARSLAAQLRVDLGGLGLAYLSVEADIDITIHSIEERGPESGQPPLTQIQLEWEAVAMPHLFPLMKAELSVYPLTSTETQLDFSGVYEPPLGTLGKIVNAVIGHRIADASIHRFVSDVAAYLRHNRGQNPGSNLARSSGTSA